VDPDQAQRIARISRSIDGWFSPQAASLFALLDEAQKRAGIAGHLFEIGVHHGRSAVLLISLARPDERFGACDIFGSQEANVSRSGSGDRAIFEANVTRVVPQFDRLDVFETLSSALRAHELSRPVRFFHVDGGHLAEEALSDLRLAASVLHDRGVIAVDDPWRIEWPGVTEGILAFLDEHDDFRPVVLGFNKLVLCRAGALEAYDAFLREHAWRYIRGSAFEAKRIPVAGHETTVFFIPVYRQIRDLDVTVARGRELIARLRRAPSRLVARRR
jgi:hypothetical protein